MITPVAIWLGLALQNPTFPGRVLESGPGPKQVIAADVNHDGLTDWVTSNAATPGQKGLSVILALPQGGYTTHVDYATNASGSAVAAGDIDSDGNTDLASTDHSLGTVSILFSNGTGGFLSFVPVVMGSESLESCVLSDINSDGYLDLLVCASSVEQKLSVRLGSNDGTFGDCNLYNSGNDPHSLKLGDINNDGVLDALIANWGPGTISVLPGNAFGGFQSPAIYPAGALLPSSVCDADLDGDGDRDIASSNAGSKNISIFLNSGTGGFGSPIKSNVGTRPIFITAGDLDGNGASDLVVANNDSGSISVIKSLGGGNFSPAKAYNTCPESTSLVLIDINSDSLLDLAVSHEDPSLVSIFHGAGSGEFIFPSTLANIEQSNSVGFMDFNSDGNTDLFTIQGLPGNQLRLRLGTGTGGFGNPTAIGVGPVPQDYAIADIDHDGILDFVTANAQTPGVSVRRGNGDATFKPVVNYLPNVTSRDIKVVDFNRDGSPDIVTANHVVGGITLLRNNTLGNFVSPLFFSMLEQPYSIEVGDFNGDHFIDIVTGGSPSVGILSLRLGNGFFSFQSAEPIPLGLGTGTAFDIERCDFNGDELQDLVLACRFGNAVVTLLGDKLGVFQRPLLSVVPSPSSSVLGDFDGDGRLDAAFASWTAGNFTLARGNGEDGWIDIVGYSGGPVLAEGIAAADINRDGRLDIAIINTPPTSSPGVITVSLNQVGSPNGVTSFGTGTPGCHGTIGISAYTSVVVGQSILKVTVTNAPPDATGDCYVGDIADFSGSDPFGLGVLFHVDLIASQIVNSSYVMRTDAGGTGVSEIRIPSNPLLFGTTVYAQSFLWNWPGLNCGAQPFGIVSSRGLAISIPTP